MFSAEELAAIRLSLQVGVVAVAASLPLAIGLGYLLARWTSPARWVLETLVNLPLVLPPVVTGYLLLQLFAPRGTVGHWLEERWGIRIVFTWWAAALAAAVVSFPLMARAIRLAFQAVDPRLEQAARSLGAGPIRAFFTIALPLAHRGVIAGATLAFARSLGEFGATIMVAGNIADQTQTIPLAIYSFTNRIDSDESVWRLVIISVLLSATALLASEVLERRQTARESQ
jgi:molybdate transport system permease protein